MLLFVISRRHRPGTRRRTNVSLGGPCLRNCIGNLSNLKEGRLPAVIFEFRRLPKPSFLAHFELTIDLLCFFVKDREMFLSPRRITCSWIASLLLGLTLLFAVSARAAQTFPKCCVWRVTNAKAPFYLVGSIHALSKRDYPLPAPYEFALRDSKRFLFEFDPKRHVEFERKFEAAGKYPPGQDIRSKIDPGLLAWLRQNVMTVKQDTRRAGRKHDGNFDGGYKPRWIATHLV